MFCRHFTFHETEHHTSQKHRASYVCGTGKACGPWREACMGRITSPFPPCRSKILEEEFFFGCVRLLSFCLFPSICFVGLEEEMEAVGATHGRFSSGIRHCLLCFFFRLCLRTRYTLSFLAPSPSTDSLCTLSASPSFFFLRCFAPPSQNWLDVPHRH